MKKILILILGLSTFACTRHKGFVIKVDIKGAEGKVLLEQRGAEAWIPVDTTYFVKGEAVFKGEVKMPGDYYLSFPGKRGKTVIFVENSKMAITGKIDSLARLHVTGSKTHDEYKEVEGQINELTEEYMALSQKSHQALIKKDTAKANELMDKVQDMYEKTGDIQYKFVINNPSSYVAPYFISNILHTKEVGDLEAMASKLDPKLDSVPSVIQLKTRIDKLKTVAVGQIAPDFTINDRKGNPLRFSDVYSQNELTLLDFWASWCEPCRNENPNIVSVYNSFKDKGFNVLGVSLDMRKSDWLKAIDEDKLAWEHVSDLSSWKSEVAQLYAINSIPSNLLVDRNGKIVARNKKGKELRNTVASFY